VQLTFVDPRSEAGPTIALAVQDEPAIPSGTVRMSAEQLAAIHKGMAAAEAGSKIQLQDQLATGPVAASAKPSIPPQTPAPATQVAPDNPPAAPRSFFRWLWDSLSGR
jgi:hypothetical protein